MVDEQAETTAPPLTDEDIVKDLFEPPWTLEWDRWEASDIATVLATAGFTIGALKLAGAFDGEDTPCCTQLWPMKELVMKSMSDGESHLLVEVSSDATVYQDGNEMYNFIATEVTFLPKPNGDEINIRVFETDGLPMDNLPPNVYMLLFEKRIAVKELTEEVLEKILYDIGFVPHEVTESYVRNRDGTFRNVPRDTPLFQ